MLTPNPTGFYQSSLLKQISGITHAYSTRQMGDMRTQSARKTLLHALGLRDNSLVLGEQVHGSGIQSVDDMTNLEIPKVDGLVVSHKQIPIGVVVADCVPLLLGDSKKGIVGAVHAGWRGTVANITKTVIDQMVALGANPANIVVSIGPHIGMCCYTVPKERAERFNSQCSYYDGSNWHLDLGVANRLQLVEAGILAEHIDAPVVCTSCQSDIFYSYRKDTKESFGEILAVIGLT